MQTKTKHSVSFYADSNTEKNKLFTFKVADKTDALKCVLRFKAKGLIIRAAFYSKFIEKLRVHNERIS